MAARSKFRIVAPEKDSIRINERIRVKEVRVIGADSEQLGVMTPEAAIEIAVEQGLDLVEVAATSRPPVCRIMDYGRYKYEQKKKKGKSTKQGHVASLKEVKLRPGTDMHDLEFKLNNARKFLMEGDKVKVTVMFRGREMVHTSRGREQLNQVLVHLGTIAKLESAPKMEGRFMSMILVADREAVAEAKRRQPVDEEKKRKEAERLELSRRELRRKKASEEALANQPEESSDEKEPTGSQEEAQGD